MFAYGNLSEMDECSADILGFLFFSIYEVIFLVLKNIEGVNKLRAKIHCNFFHSSLIQ